MASRQVERVAAMAPLGLRQVQVGGEIGRRIEATVRANLLAIDVESAFLRPFRDRNLEQGYIGLGKLIDATVRFAAYTSDPAVLKLKERLVAAAIALQEPDGYIGILAPAGRIWGVYDIHETAHIVLGLANDHRYFGEERSLAAARALADYIVGGWTAEPGRIPGPTGKRGQMYGVTTGLDAALLTLYEQTREARYLDFMVGFPPYRLARWDAAPKIGLDHMDNERHCYIYMALCVAQMQLHGIRPDPGLFAQAHRAVDFLTRRDGQLASGSCSLGEGWHSDQCGSGHASESCATAYLIRMLDRLFAAEANPLYGDMAERAVHNALFAAQSPDGRWLRYFSPLEGERTYFDRDTFCCPNNFRRIMAELPAMLYYRTNGGLAVNHYTASTARTPLDDHGLSLTVRQETDYPTSGQVLLRVDPSRPAMFAVDLRLPRWSGAPRVRVNGRPLEPDREPGALMRLEREWLPGDRVELEMPMPCRWVRGRQRQAGRAALMRGPVLFCLNPARNETLAGADLSQVAVDPSAPVETVDDDSVRPGGQACRVRAWSPGRLAGGGAPDLTLMLTEFADPGGQATHLRVPPVLAEACVEDELCAGSLH